ncbi:ABC transporter substrate-binding protein [Sphingomonas oleivorans]|uniref:ABC transporter substrate-binding protein n=1 Tax=Sphingomonas oleivorans TaxID=1735121 RepID=A0A2T5FVJ0_9SPHN|nr:extracellular solute-binding protein [Sphingomonas oleivorans]PTQ09796.1 ABC transporter substrate-binding protein [Sphingomonas oleivorans]
MGRRAYVKGALAVLVGLMAFAISQYPDRSAEAGEAKVTVLVEGGSPAFKALQKVKPDFEKKYKVKLEIATAPYMGVRDKLISEVVSPTGAYDVAAIDVLWFPLVRNVLEPLDDLATPEVRADLFPHLLSGATFDGRLYGMPLWDNAEILVYRKDLFDDAAEQAAFRRRYGYALRPPTNWQELKDVAAFFTRDLDGDGKTDMFGTSLEGFGGHGDAVTNWLYLAAQAGAKSYVTDGRGEIVIDSQPYLKASHFLIDLIDAKLVPPTYMEMASPQNVELFKAGKLATTYVWAHFLPDLYRSAAAGRAGGIGVAPNVGGAVPGAWYNVVFRASKSKSAARALVSYLFEHDDAVADAFGVAARRSVLEARATMPEGAHLPALIRTLEDRGTFDRPALRRWSEIEESVLIPTLQTILLREKTPEEALPQARDEIALILNRQRARP